MAKKVYIDFELKYKEAVKNLDEMQSEYSKLEKQVDKTSDSQKELGGILDSTTGGAITKFKGLKGTLGTVIKSFKSLKVAVMATGIGLLVVAVGALAAAFSSSEKGQNQFAKMMGMIGVVVNNTMDIIANFGSSVISAGKALFKLATGDLKGASEAWQDAKDSVNEATDSIKNFGEESKREMAIANDIANKRARADKEERQLLLERAEADRKVAELREIAADKENVSVEKRIEAIKEAGRIAEEITEKEIATARLRFEAKKAENEMSKSTKEDLDEQAQLQARLIELETARLRKQKALTAEITTSLREAQAERNAILAEQKAKEAEEEKLAKEKQAAEDKADIDRLKTLAEQKKVIIDKELADEKALAAAKLAIKNAAAGALISAFNILASTDKKNRKLQAAMLIARNAVGIASNIINTNAANATLTLQGGVAAPALILANNIRMITGIAASVAATAQGLKALKVGGSAASSGATAGGRASTQAPAFNVVGASASNQLAESIAGQQQQPIQAFVVSNDVSTAQELDRNIITGASIG